MHLIAPHSHAGCAGAHAPGIAVSLVGQASRATFVLAQRLQKVPRKTGHTPGGAHDHNDHAFDP
jgi:hypothetical protein